MYDLNLAKNRFQNYRNQDFRTHQAEAIKYVLESEKKIVMIEGPTGCGKSLLGMVSGEAFGSLTYVIHSKSLQAQITNDFPESKSLFGRGNYICKRNPEVFCDECSSTQQSFCQHKKSDCEYESRKREVLGTKLKILNTAYFLSEANFAGKFSGAPFIVIDEGDILESNLLSFISLSFTNYALRRLGLQDMSVKLNKTSKFKDKLLEDWKDFGNQAVYRINAIIKRVTGEIEYSSSLNDYVIRLIKERQSVVRLKEKIDLFLNNVSSEWILEESTDRLSWRPLWITPELSERYLLRHGQKFLIMSASFLPIHIEAKRLGFDMDDIDYKILPSTFPVENCKVIVNPVADLTSKKMDEEVPKVITEVKRILALHPNEKGLIHSVSFKLANQVYEGVNDPRLIIHNSTDRQKILNDFLKSTSNAVCLSPSMERGISLDGDLARFQIILKMPWLSLGDKIVQARVYGSTLGQEWFQATALLSVLQAAGRAVRSINDFAVCYVLDYQFKKALQQRPSYLPEWFLDRIIFI
jgi:ATP-dependent DNA helicase DinG